MTDLSIKVEIMAKDIEFLKTEMGEIKQLIKDRTIEERETWEKLLDTKAGKWVEDAFKWGLYSVAGIILFAIIALIIKSKLSGVSPF